MKIDNSRSRTIRVLGALFLFTGLVLGALGAYYYFNLESTHFQVNTFLEDKAYVKYFVQTNKFNFAYNIPGSKLRITKDNQVLEINYRGWGEDEKFYALAENWTKLSDDGVTRLYSPDQQTCRFLVIYVNYAKKTTQLSTDSLDSIKCVGNLETLNTLVQI